MELSSGGQDPCSPGFPHPVSVLGTHLDQYTCWRCCERLGLAAVSFFELIQHVCRFHDGGFTSAPAHTLLNVQLFLTKNGMTPVPQSPY